MKIANIETFPVRLQLQKPFRIANVVNYDMFYVIVRITADCGTAGYGEAIPAWEVTGETQFGVIDVIRHFCDPGKTGMNLIGEDISDFSTITSLIGDLSPIDKPQLVWGAPSAKAALEEAILDLYGRKTGKPVYALFGGTNRKIPVFPSVGIYPVKETIDNVRSTLDTGVKIIKLKTGIKKIGDLDNYARDVQVIREARKLIDAEDPSVKLVADANQGYADPDTAIAVIKEVEGCLDWLEQPILADDKLGFKTIKDACDIKLMADESVHNYFDAQLLLDLQAVDYINLKIMKTGGLIEALRIADLAEEYGVECHMGSMLENAIGSAICAHTFLCHDNITAAQLRSFARLREPIGTGITLEDNCVEISDNPGIGIEVDEKDIKKHLVNAEKYD